MRPYALESLQVQLGGQIQPRDMLTEMNPRDGKTSRAYRLQDEPRLSFAPPPFSSRPVVSARRLAVLRETGRVSNLSCRPCAGARLHATVPRSCA